MAARKVSIDLAPGLTNGHVQIDGDPVRGVRGVTVHADVNSIPTVTLDVIVRAAEFNGEAHVDVPEKTRETLIALGWTPPAEQATSSEIS